MCDPVSAVVAVVAASQLLDDGGGGGGGSAAAPAAPAVDPAEAERKKAEEKAAAEAKAAEERAAAERAAEAERQRVAAEQKAARLSAGRSSIDDAFGPFDTSYYNNVSQSYNDFATDNLNKQYQSQLGNLISTLARSGTLNTAARTRGVDDLRTQYDSAMANLPSASSNLVSALRSNVDSAKTGLYSTNDTDPGVDSIKTSAIAKASDLKQTNFSPLATLMIDPSQYAVGRGSVAGAAKAGGAASPALFSQARQSRGGGYTVV
jgi:hypothetical protein